MEGSLKWRVVVVPFPFSDLKTVKRRPALVLADLAGEDIICAAITSTGLDPAGVPLTNADFEFGGIFVPSTIRASKLFTLIKDQIEKVVGKVKDAKRMQVVQKINFLMA